MGIAYEKDIVAWANEQASFIRAGRFELLDLEHIAEEIEDVGKSEQRELENRMAILLAHLLKWQYQPARRGASWQKTIKVQRTQVNRRIQKTPSFKHTLQDTEWWEDTWGDAITQASKETGIELTVFPEICPWTPEQILDLEFFPN
jgi:hypothetical protein